jgi:uncharacterized protein YndB with AHSA1/START domain
MGTILDSTARATVLENGGVLATVDVAASVDRVFRALTSDDVTKWWVSPGTFATKWIGDVRVGGRWQAIGVRNGRPYTLEGEFIELTPPRSMAYTWQTPGAEGPPTTVSYLLEPSDLGTRVLLRHSGLVSSETWDTISIGWETSLAHLAMLLGRERALDISSRVFTGPPTP